VDNDSLGDRREDDGRLPWLVRRLVLYAYLRETVCFWYTSSATAMITLDELKSICTAAPEERLTKFVDPLNKAMATYEIDDIQRETAFIAQIAHESGQFRYVRELWGPTPAQTGYEGRSDLGNTQVGDGRKFLGRGLIQITGRANYAACGVALGLDLLAHPELLETPENACNSAAWWWFEHGCNEIADSGDFKRLTKRINGGYNGLMDRVALYEQAQKVMG